MRYLIAIVAALSMGATPEQYKEFVELSRAHTVKERSMLQQRVAKFSGRKSDSPFADKLQATTKGGLVPVPIPEVTMNRISGVAVYNGTVGTVGALSAAAASGGIVEIVDQDSVVADIHVVRYELIPPKNGGNYYESRTATRAPARAVPGTIRATIHGVDSATMKVGELAAMPPVVELVSLNPLAYRAVPYLELRPYLKGKTVIGLDKPKPAKP